MSKENKKLTMGFAIVFLVVLAGTALFQVGKKVGFIPQDFLKKPSAASQVLGEGTDEFSEHSAVQDSDGDGLANLVEARAGTDQNKPDTDGDGYTDKQEIETQNNPLVAATVKKGEAGKDDFNTDNDGDGLSNAQEKIYKTDVNKKDTDNDGFTDKQEVGSGHNPLK